MRHKLKSNNIDYLKSTFQIGTDVYKDSQNEAKEIRDFFTNRHYTLAQINALKNRGQPVETFNIILQMTRAYKGFLNSIENEPRVEARNFDSNELASLLNDYVKYTLDKNSFRLVRSAYELDGILSGLMCVYIDVKPTKETDSLGRTKYEIKFEHIPSYQLVLDHKSTQLDYSDARYIHRFKWLSKEEFISLYGAKKLSKITEDNNFTGEVLAEAQDITKGAYGNYEANDQYLVVHTIVKEDNGKVYSVHWSDETILFKKEITYKEVLFPYKVVKLNDNLGLSEFYSPFREIIESQKAINQAMLQIQLLSNTSKAIVEEGAVEDIDVFKEAFTRVNSVITVNNRQGIEIVDMSRDIQKQYYIIDKAHERIKSVLGINDSFLGQAYASDSGRKVQLQAQHTAGMLSYLSDKTSYMVELIGRDIMNLAKQYVVAEDVLRVSDPIVGERYFHINKPIEEPMKDNMGNPMFNELGQLATVPVLVPDVNPENGKPKYNSDGTPRLKPLSSPETTLAFTDADVKVDTVIADQSKEKDQLLLETVINGAMGQFMQQVNPAGYAMTCALSLKNYGAKYSMAISDIYLQTALQLSNGQLDPSLESLSNMKSSILGASLGGNTGHSQNSPKSPTMQIPTGVDQGGNQQQGGTPPQQQGSM